MHDQPVRFLKGRLRLRQVTRLTETGHQTAVLTSRWDLRDIVVAYRMFERWRQENFFKYMRQEFLIDDLADYQAEPDDPNRSIPNPARKGVNSELRKARAHFAKLQEKYGSTALDYLQGRTPTMSAFTIAEEARKLATGEAEASVRADLAAAYQQAATAVQENDGALVIFTTGSTGAPKPALLSHRNITCEKCALVRRFSEATQAPRRS